MSVRTWFIIMVATAFISVIGFFQINSAWADANNFNTGWLLIGIIFGLAACFCLYKVSSGGGTPTS